MRWRAIFFINNNKKATKDYKQVFCCGVKSGKRLPQVQDLMQFADDLIRIVKQLKFREVKNNFHKKLREDMKCADSKENTNSRRQDIQYVQIK